MMLPNLLSDAKSETYLDYNVLFQQIGRCEGEILEKTAQT